MYIEVLSVRLKDARVKSGFTQDEVSKETEIKRAMISAYELGNAVPSVEKLGILAEFYGVSTDWLLGLARKKDNKYYYDDEMSIATEKKPSKIS